MFDHIVIDIGDLERSKSVYTAALAELGISLQEELGDEMAGYGADAPRFWLAARGKANGGPVHLAFAASGRDAVDAFHKAALASGATDNGAPGLRPDYGDSYYAAFVLDADGNNIEAVYQGS